LNWEINLFNLAAASSQVRPYTLRMAGLPVVLMPMVTRPSQRPSGRLRMLPSPFPRLGIRLLLENMFTKVFRLPEHFFEEAKTLLINQCVKITKFT
jgi:hypothetical protein